MIDWEHDAGNPRGLPKQILRVLHESGTHSTAELANRLATSEALVRLMAETLARRGYLAALVPGCTRGCNSCVLSAACTAPAAPIFMLTDKGRRTAGCPE